MLKECNDLETNMVVGQIQSTATGLLRASGTACVLLAGDAKAREEEFKRAASARGLNRSSTFRNYTHSEPRFRVLLTEDGTQRLELSRS